MEIAIKNINQLDEVAKNVYDMNINLLCLTGELGSGKTTFTQKFGKILDVTDLIKSPSFTIHSEYKIPNSKNGILHHIDLYRIDSLTEFNELQLDKILNKENYVIIEWADKFSCEIKHLSKDAIWIDFEMISESKRLINIRISK